MSCCGYHTLSWYYTYPSNPYKYVQIRGPTQSAAQPGMLIEFGNDSKQTKENYTPSSSPSSWYDLGMGWYNPPRKPT
jgi:hypothetical protein